MERSELLKLRNNTHATPLAPLMDLINENINAKIYLYKSNTYFKRNVSNVDNSFVYFTKKKKKSCVFFKFKLFISLFFFLEILMEKYKEIW